ncbi:Ribokinase-like protein [Entophlyctis helioformis]|nr:Ribokinase-like protein [Entophlyctis helioformis]
MALNIFVVGAIYQDVILHVDEFPEEDSKTRAKRQGGNTLDVLSQLRPLHPHPMHLAMVASLAGTDPTSTSPSTATDVTRDLAARNISLSHSVFHGCSVRQPTAWIISTPATRTILNENSLPDLTAAAFGASALPAIRMALERGERVWVHFEGRSVAEIRGMVAALGDLRSAGNAGDAGRLTVSVEFEKLGRPDLESLLPVADVAFFSKAWVAGNAAHQRDGSEMDASDHACGEYLRSVGKAQCRAGAHLFATWGEHGAFHVQAGQDAVTHLPSPPVHAVDTIGAGDTFVAGVLFGMGCAQQSPVVAGNFATQLASAKCGQNGFGGILPSASKAYDRAMRTA